MWQVKNKPEENTYTQVAKRQSLLFWDYQFVSPKWDTLI